MIINFLFSLSQGSLARIDSFAGNSVFVGCTLLSIDGGWRGHQVGGASLCFSWFDFVSMELVELSDRRGSL